MASLTALSGLISSASAASDTAMTQTFSLQSTDWGDNASLPLFDGSLGTLDGVEFELVPEISGTLGYENLEASPQLVTIVLAAEITVAAPAGFGALPPLVSAASQVELSLFASAYDLSTDYSGTSGNTFNWAFPSELVLETYDADNPLWELSLRDYFTAGAPGETVDLPVAATGQSSVSAPGLFGSVEDTSAGAELKVTYTYTPVPEPGPLALLSVAMLAMSRRRR